MRSLATKFITVTAIVVAGATVLTPASHAGSNNGDAMAPSNSVVESNMFDIEAFGLAATDFGDDGKGEPDRL